MKGNSAHRVHSGIRCRPDGPINEHRIMAKGTTDLIGNSFQLEYQIHARQYIKN